MRSKRLKKVTENDKIMLLFRGKRIGILFCEVPIYRYIDKSFELCENTRKSIGNVTEKEKMNMVKAL